MSARHAAKSAGRRQEKQPHTYFAYRAHKSADSCRDELRDYFARVLFRYFRASCIIETLSQRAAMAE